MSVDISRLAYSLRLASEGSFHPIKHTHALELIAAALGYKSLAAYKAALSSGLESADLSQASHMVVATQLLFARTNQLNSMASLSSRLEMVLRALKDCLPEVRIWENEERLYEHFVHVIDRTTFDHGKVSSVVVDLNVDGVREIYMPVHFSLDELSPVGQLHRIEIAGHIVMDIDHEKPYHGHKIYVKASLTLERLAKFVIAEPVFELESAKLDVSWYGEDEEARA